jgi:NAD(P)-dependent dehydrogenase (short-subunit alcohol dehydrogenase family)
VSSPADLFSLRDRTALVTGGSRGLGLEIAEGLGQAGARVAVVARRREWLDEARRRLADRGVEALALEGDVAESRDVVRVVEEATAALGRIDILVNAAGRSWGAPAAEMPLAKWHEVMEANATGTFLMCQTVGRAMIARRFGRIINVASLAGLAGQPADVLDAVAYSASKGAIIALTRDLAVKWAPHGVTVNAIAPGWFPTRMSEKVIERAGRRLEALIPMGRVGRPGEIKGAAVFLASDAASYITGQVFAIDGGLLAQ